MSNAIHWTERSPQDFLYSIASNFVEELQARMETIGMSKSQLADSAKVHKSFVSRLFKNPGNLSLETMVKFARCVGLKVSIVPYEDIHDPDNNRGPIDSSVFRWCWEHAERPSDLWDVESIKQTAAMTGAVVDMATLITIFDLGVDAVSYSLDIRRKHSVISGSQDIDLPDVTIKESRNTSRSARLAA